MVVHRQTASPERVSQVMAKGNIGNLLQHFVALRVAQTLVNKWDHADSPIEYIDCYSMAPWEKIESRQPQGFVGLVQSFTDMKKKGDFVASVFLQASQDRYGPNFVPQHPQESYYPNTAVLLRSGFPNQKWAMRLHEDDSTKIGKNADLTCWAQKQPNGTYNVGRDWTQSNLIRNSPAPTDRPVFVMLDPFKIVRHNNDLSNGNGYLPYRLLRFLVGEHALNIRQRPVNGETMPLVVTLFSYTDSHPEIADGIVRELFAGPHWQVESVRSGPWHGRNGKNWHCGWIVSFGLNFPLLGIPFQAEWDKWTQGA